MSSQGGQGKPFSGEIEPGELVTITSELQEMLQEDSQAEGK